MITRENLPAGTFITIQFGGGGATQLAVIVAWSKTGSQGRETDVLRVRKYRNKSRTWTAVVSVTPDRVLGAAGTNSRLSLREMNQAKKALAAMAGVSKLADKAEAARGT